MAQVTLKGNPVNTSGNLPTVGSKAPDFQLVRSNLTESTLADYKGLQIILNIFPSVDTSTCAMSVRKFNERAAGLENTVVLCISKDLPFAQNRFCGAEGIDRVVTLSNFRDGGDFGNDYGVELLDSPLKGLNARSVFVIGKDGTIRYVQLVPEIGTEPDYEAALAALVN
ncbi:MAG: thiol peroxidase [Cyclobacteriaceae bacterium]|nr:thiol peroxidase [Cyclobacteriaceae bacterium]